MQEQYQVRMVYLVGLKLQNDISNSADVFNPCEAQNVNSFDVLASRDPKELRN